MDKYGFVTYAGFLQGRTQEYSSDFLNDLQKSPYIYFSCHPDDRDIYFEEIRDDIFEYCKEQKCDCAIWFDANPEESRDDEEMKDVLSRMNLIVIPVTDKYLHDYSNSALEKELEYACKELIPIFPILMDSNLQGDFDETCGDIHAIDRNNNENLTGKTYKESLAEVLSRSLMDSDLYLLKDEFSAHIFLSYRKKDRKYARELMKLIHQNDFCRDINIWYDEYLVPGENFTTALQKEIDESAMVLLLVTPNIVEDDNYVVNDEYPYARDQGKNILPVVMVDLNGKEREDFNDKFEDVKDFLIDASDSSLLSASLSKQFHDLVEKGNDNNPEHLYRIGRAYKDGIYTEKNSKLGVKLIKEAAQKDYLPALEELAYMYLYGDSVEINPGKSVECIEKAVKCAEDQFNKDKSDENGVTLHFLYYQLSGMGFSIYQSYYQSSRESVAMNDVMDGMDEIIGLCNKDISLLKGLQGSDDSRISQCVERYLFTTYISLGYIYLLYAQYINEEKLKDAENSYQMAQNLYDDELSKSETIDKKDKDDLKSRLDNFYGTLCYVKNDNSGAVEYFQKSHETETDSNILDSVTTLEKKYNENILFYDNKATCLKKEGKYLEAKENYEEELKWEKKLDKSEDNKLQIASTMNNICGCEISILRSSGDKKDLKEIEEYAEGCRENSDKLPRESTSAMIELVKSLDHLGDVYDIEAQIYSEKKPFKKFFVNAEKYYKKNKDIRERILKEKDSDKSRIDLANVCVNLGKLYQKNGEASYKAAEKEFQQCINLLEKVSDNVDSKEQILKSVADTYLKMAKSCDDGSNLSEEEKYLQDVLLLTEIPYDKGKTEDLFWNMAFANMELVRIYNNEAHSKEKGKYFSDGIKILEKLYDETKDDWYLDRMAGFYYQYGSPFDTDKLNKLKRIYEYLNDKYPGKYSRILNYLKNILC